MDRDHDDSRISVERASPDRAWVVWRMSADVAEQLAMLVSDHAAHDDGWRTDAESLFEAAEEARAAIEGGRT